MAKVVAYIRSSKRAKSASVRFRLTDSKFDISHTSEIEINPNHFDKILQGYSSKANVSDKVRLDFNRKILDRKQLLIELYNSADKSLKLTSSWFNQKVAERIIRIENYVFEIMGYIRRFWNWALNDQGFLVAVTSATGIFWMLHIWACR